MRRMASDTPEQVKTIRKQRGGRRGYTARLGRPPATPEQQQDRLARIALERKLQYHMEWAGLIRAILDKWSTL